MRCSKLCVILLIVGIGAAVILASTGNAKAASFLSFLPLLACPLMCVGMMMFGKCGKGEDGKCHDTRKRKTISNPVQDNVEG